MAPFVESEREKCSFLREFAVHPLLSAALRQFTGRTDAVQHYCAHHVPHAAGYRHMQQEPMLEQGYIGRLIHLARPLSSPPPTKPSPRSPPTPSRSSSNPRTSRSSTPSSNTTSSPAPPSTPRMLKDLKPEQEYVQHVESLPAREDREICLEFGLQHSWPDSYSVLCPRSVPTWHKLVQHQSQPAVGARFTTVIIKHPSRSQAKGRSAVAMCRELLPVGLTTPTTSPNFKIRSECSPKRCPLSTVIVLQQQQQIHLRFVHLLNRNPRLA